ncbi:MAG: hypothetical protein WDO19_08290 [Bacteroidota bacterium]
MVNLIKKSVGRLQVRNYWHIRFLLLVIGWANFMACKEKSRSSSSTADSAAITPAQKSHYDLSKPEGIVLGDKLHEISGIAYTSAHTILGENDEQGKIFTIDPTKPGDTEYPSVRFGGKGDYEDIVVVDSTAYLLISDGEIVEVPGYTKGGEVTGTIVAQMGGKHNEFETLYFDKTVNSLIMVCKSCHHEKDEIRTAYRFDLTTKKFSDTAYYTIPIIDIARKLDDNSITFRPSAAAINPVQDKLYILASIGKLLVVTDKQGKVEEAFKLDAAIFNQPEGITFAPNGDMFISNEGGEGKATLLKFVYKP